MRKLVEQHGTCSDPTCPEQIIVVGTSLIQGDQLSVAVMFVFPDLKVPFRLAWAYSPWSQLDFFISSLRNMESSQNLPKATCQCWKGCSPMPAGPKLSPTSGAQTIHSQIQSSWIKIPQNTLKNPNSLSSLLSFVSWWVQGTSAMVSWPICLNLVFSSFRFCVCDREHNLISL